jgi:hypothetical protein
MWYWLWDIVKMQKVVVDADDVAYGWGTLLRIKIILFVDNLSEWADTPETQLMTIWSVMWPFCGSRQTKLEVLSSVCWSIRSVSPCTTCGPAGTDNTSFNRESVCCLWPNLITILMCCLHTYPKWEPNPRPVTADEESRYYVCTVIRCISYNPIVQDSSTSVFAQ